MSSRLTFLPIPTMRVQILDCKPCGAGALVPPCSKSIHTNTSLCSVQTTTLDTTRKIPYTIIANDFVPFLMLSMMADLLGDSRPPSECPSPVYEQMQMGEASADNVFDENMPDLDVLLDEFKLQGSPVEPTGPISGDVSLNSSEFVNPSAIANSPELLDLPNFDLTCLTGLPQAPRPIEPQVFRNTWYQLPPRRVTPAPQRRRPMLVPSTRRPHHRQPPRYLYPLPRTSPAQHNWNLIESALGVIPCARPLPAFISPSFLWRRIPGPQSASTASISQEIDALYPDEEPDPAEDQFQGPPGYRRKQPRVASPPLSPADLQKDSNTDSASDSDNVTGSATGLGSLCAAA